LGHINLHIQTQYVPLIKTKFDDGNEDIQFI
jgi:hypothetical protein